MVVVAVEMAVMMISTLTAVMATTTTVATATMVDTYNNQLIAAAEEMVEMATATAIAAETTRQWRQRQQ